MYVFDLNVLKKKKWTELSFVEKAAVLTSTGGQLDTEDAVKFIDTVVDMSAFLKAITIEKTVAATKNIDTIGIATRQFRSAVEATLASTAQTTNFTATLPRRTLTMKEVILAPDISYTWLHENIEREAAEAHLMNLAAKAFMNDIVDLCGNGDETSTTTFLALNDGWITLALADSNVNDQDCGGMSPIDALNAILKKLPEKYQGLKDQLKFFCSYTFDFSYREALAARNTAGGDNYLLNNPKCYYGGVEVYPVYAFPSNYIILTTFDNLVVGFNKELTVEKMLQPRKQVIEYTMTAKFDPQYAVGEKMVLGANVGV